MADRGLTFGERGLNAPRIRSLLWEELADFRRDFQESPIREEQDLRALFIAWMAAFLPEVAPDGFWEELRSVVTGFRARTDFSAHGWHRLVPLDVALFVGTGEHQWLDICRPNVDHHKSELRTFVIDCLALAAPRLEFDGEMIARTENNLRVRHGVSSW